MFTWIIFLIIFVFYCLTLKLFVKNRFSVFSDPIPTFETYHSTHLNSFVIFIVNPFVTIFFRKYFRLIVPLLRFKILYEWRKEHKSIYMTVVGVICKTRQNYLYVLWLTKKRYISLLRSYRRHKNTTNKI